MLRKESELLGDHDGDPIHKTKMPPPTTNMFLDARVLSLASLCLAISGGHASSSHVPRTLLAAPIPVPRP